MFALFNLFKTSVALTITLASVLIERIEFVDDLGLFFYQLVSLPQVAGAAPIILSGAVSLSQPPALTGAPLVQLTSGSVVPAHVNPLLAAQQTLIRVISMITHYIAILKYRYQKGKLCVKYVHENELGSNTLEFKVELATLAICFRK